MDQVRALLSSCRHDCVGRTDEIQVEFEGDTSIVLPMIPGTSEREREEERMEREGERREREEGGRRRWKKEALTE